MRSGFLTSCSPEEEIFAATPRSVVIEVLPDLRMVVVGGGCCCCCCCCCNSIASASSSSAPSETCVRKDSLCEQKALILFFFCAWEVCAAKKNCKVSHLCTSALTPH